MPKKKKFVKKSEQTTATSAQQSVPTETDFPELGSVGTTQERRPTGLQTQPKPIASDIKLEKHKSKPIPSSTQVSRASGPLEASVRPKESPIAGQSSGHSSESPKTDETGDKSKQTKSEDLTLAQEIREKFVIESVPKRVFAKRPGFLTEGRSVALLTNHFLLSVGKKEAFHYDIEIESKPKKTEQLLNIVDKEVEDKSKEKKKTKFTRKMATKLNRKIFQQMIKSYSGLNEVFYGINPVYDGQKNMFTSKILDGTDSKGEEKKSIRLTVDLEENKRISTFFVNIKLAEKKFKIDLNILNEYHKGSTCDDEVVKKSILFINTLLRHNSALEMTPIGQSIFDPKILGQEISRFVLLAYGHYSSVRNLMVGPTLNIDRSAACFYKPSKADDFIEDIIRGDLSRLPKLSEFDKKKIRKELTGLQIEATHISYEGTTGSYFRKYRVLGVSVKSAKEHTFQWKERNNSGKDENRGTVSIADYFRLKYNKPLKYPHLPCLEVGNPSNKVYLPFEVCKIVPQQRLRRSLTNRERSDMTTIAGSQTPKDRLKQCERFVSEQYKSGRIAQLNRPFLYEFGIDVDKGLLEVDSKIIEPPTLKYSSESGRSKSVVPQHGEWEMYKTGSTFLRAASLEKWIIVNLSFTQSFTDTNIELFAKELCSQALEMGMKVMPQSTIAKINKTNNFNPKITFNGIKTRIQQSFRGIQMILFITPNKSDPFSDDIYSEIKLLGDVDKGFATQCVNVANIWNGRRKWNRSYLRQLMLKINPKLGGTNVALHESTPAMPSILKDKSLMIIGSDVNHPAPADRITPSIAAVVGSYDNEFSHYFTTVSMQPKSREEMIQKFDKMVIEIINNFKKQRNDSLPQKIIVFRDGVSEGQFQHVIDNEYSLLEKAFKSFGPNYNPKITFIIVQKRHHTRFVPKQVYNSSDPNPRFQNISPGTVVEKSITHKTDFDFYLCSHEGRLGTSRPAHYYVLEDQNKFNANDMCKMTYYLCHIYARCTKSVSIPAPVYYADLAAYRAKVHASALQDSELSSSDSVTSGDSGRDAANEENKIKAYENLIKVLPNQKLRLYFM